MRVDQAAHHIPERRTHRDRAEENRHDAPAPADRKIIGQQGWGDRAVRRLADAHRGTRRDQRKVIASESRQRGGHAPDRDAQGNQARAGPPVTKSAEHRGSGHVDDQEGAHQETELAIAERERRVFQAFEKRRNDKPVQVIEQVDQREDR